MRVFGALVLVLCTLVHPVEARVLSPEEARVFADRIFEQSTAGDYWGVWRFRDVPLGEEHFVEVLFLRNTGYAWRVLGEEKTLNMRLGNYRYVVNLESGELESVYPLLELPFAPLEKDAFPLLLENYLFDLQEGELFLISKWTGKVVRSLLLGGEEEIVGQRVYSPHGELLAEWKMLYRDTSPEFPWVARLLSLLESWKGKILGSEPLAMSSCDGLFLPEFVPPGFQLRRAYLLRDGEKKFYGLVYSDGLASFVLFQSVYPFKVSGSSKLRYLRITREGKGIQVVAEREGFYFLLIGGLDPRVGKEVLQSLPEKGGR